MPDMRILHWPFLQPYNRKLHCEHYSIVNGVRGAARAIGGRELARIADYDFFDVLHIHSLDYVTREDLDTILEKCSAARRGVVFTFHDLSPLHAEDDNDFQIKVEALCHAGAQFVFLTGGSRDVASARWKVPAARVVPHGLLLDPDSAAWESGRPREHGPQFAMYGRWRPNRAYLATVLNWMLGVSSEQRGELHVLLPGVADRALDEPGEEVGDLLRLAVHGEGYGMQVRLRPRILDADVLEFLSGMHVLLMPYRYGTHSGQLELAFDLGLAPVITNVGFYEEQWQPVADLVDRPIFVDWADGNADMYGQRWLAAMNEARSWRPPGSRARAMLRSYRRAEHREILGSFLEVYRAAMG
jgi:hypothetical protein